MTGPKRSRRPAIKVVGNAIVVRSKVLRGRGGEQAEAPSDGAPPWEGAQAGGVEFRLKKARARGLLALLRYGRRRRGRDAPDLPGLWYTPQRSYQIARECVVEHDDGWATETGDPGHRFVSWELAVRYEAAALSARLHYTQICDLAGYEECEERIARMSGHLDEMRRLSEIERAVRPMLGDDPKVLKSMSFCPRPLYEEAPAEPRLEQLAGAHLDDLLPSLDRVVALQASGAPFQPEALALLLQADRRIPGVGMPHGVFVDDRRYVYPFDAEFEAVIRPQTAHTIGRPAQTLQHPQFGSVYQLPHPARPAGVHAPHPAAHHHPPPPAVAARCPASSRGGRHWSISGRADARVRRCEHCLELGVCHKAKSMGTPSDNIPPITPS